MIFCSGGIDFYVFCCACLAFHAMRLLDDHYTEETNSSTYHIFDRMEIQNLKLNFYLLRLELSYSHCEVVAI